MYWRKKAMIGFLRKSWLTLAILICAAAFIPLVMSFISHDPKQNFDAGLLLLGVWIFMAGIVFALICVVLVLVGSANKKRSTKA
jgi:membrane protein implicated in regulation of membrane protease activity